jgi:hypothetical protein
LVLDEEIEADFSGPRPVLRTRRSDAAPRAADRVSPVLLDETGQPRALPGGVVVVLPGEMDDGAAIELILAAGGTPLRRIGRTLWLVQSPSGLQSLEVAETLLQSGRFTAVEPNWWSPRQRK